MPRVACAALGCIAIGHMCRVLSGQEVADHGYSGVDSSRAVLLDWLIGYVSGRFYLLVLRSDTYVGCFVFGNRGDFLLLIVWV